jgi:hypothetical protein
MKKGEEYILNGHSILIIAGVPRSSLIASFENQPELREPLDRRRNERRNQQIS